LTTVPDLGKRERMTWSITSSRQKSKFHKMKKS
jgi:hypothetical protein